MKYLLFGTGDYYYRFRKWFDKKDVVALIDNSIDKQGTIIDGVCILSPEDAIKYEFDVVVILSFYVVEMKKQLVELGISEKKIYHFYQLHDLLGTKFCRRAVKRYQTLNVKERGRKVALFSHDLDLGGPALALKNVALFLDKNGFSVTFISMIDGPLGQSLSENGIEVVVDENLQLQTMRESCWYLGYDLILCNTINYYVFLSERNKEIPTIWWLHDSPFFYGGVDKKRLGQIPMENMQVVGVGPIPQQALHMLRPEIPMKDLLYGVPLYETGKVSENQDVMTFITAGYIERRKGQDILVDAIKLLPQAILEKCEFLFVGQNTSAMAQELMRKTEMIPQVHMIGTVNREKMHLLLASADMMICPSREDPMPTVVAEAMTHAVPTLLSDSTGTAKYIQNGENGLLFANENTMQLAEKIQWCFYNRDQVREMGEKAYATYEQVFSVSAFESNLTSLIDRCLKS